MALKKCLEGTGLREVVARAPSRGCDGLLAQLRDLDPQVRRWGARDLAPHREAAQALASHLLAEPDASVREAAFTSLERMAGPETAQALLPLLRSDDAGLRNGAIEALASMPEATAPHIDALLADTDPDVRLFTVNLLRELPHARVPAWLERVLRQEREANVVAAAIEVLAEVGTPALLPALQAARDRYPADPFIPFAAEVARERMEAS
jgi:HEAT repeat protein